MPNARFSTTMCTVLGRLRLLRREYHMNEVRWSLYPLVSDNEIARAWLQMQAHLQLAPKTIDAYGRCLNDYLAFCAKQHVIPETITHEQVALYVHDLATRPHRLGAN